MDIIFYSSWAMWFVAGVLYITDRIKHYQFDGLWSIGNLLFTIDDVRSHHWIAATINSILWALFAYHWWNGGGGDDTKRRLKKLVRRFQAVRRTAPQSA